MERCAWIPIDAVAMVAPSQLIAVNARCASLTGAIIPRVIGSRLRIRQRSASSCYRVTGRRVNDADPRMRLVIWRDGRVLEVRGALWHTWGSGSLVSYDWRQPILR